MYESGKYTKQKEDTQSLLYKTTRENAQNG